MIIINKSKTADARTCDYSKVSKETLIESSNQHIDDVIKGINFMVDKLINAGHSHDHDKLSDIDGFHKDFLTGFKVTTWWDKHRLISRHHLLGDGGVPNDVNLLDVIEMIIDCVMAGMARSGSVYPLKIKSEILWNAFNNTVDMLKNNIVVKD
jgi:hypothetical protein